MAKTSSLVKSLTVAFPGITFAVSDDFRWAPSESTVYYVVEGDAQASENLLHETAHGLLKHADYGRDIDLLKLERDAWTYAVTLLGPQFDVSISDDTVEDALDSYRSWLHKRSLCPSCEQTGIQNSQDTYRCLGCGTSWRTNEARRCGLKRYKIEPAKTPAH